LARYRVESAGKRYTVAVVDKTTGGGTVTIDGREFNVDFIGDEENSASPMPVDAVSVTAPTPSTAPAGGEAIVAPIHGKVVAILVKVGDPVTADQVVIKLEAMKMENEISSPVSGIVEEAAVGEGTEVAGGQLLMLIC
jgi:biotin carboxyl carrier protein